MFGIFYALANLIGITVSGTKRAIDNEYYKELGRESYKNGTDSGKHTYYDAEGIERDLYNNHIMFTYRENGDLFIKDTKTHEIRNLTEEKKIKEIKEIKKNNPQIKAVFYKHWNHSNSGLKDGTFGISGTVYKDVNNGQLYFERYITWRRSDFSKRGTYGDICAAYFYLRISDGKIECIADRQIEEDKKFNRNEDYNDFISFFNSEQDKGGFIVRNRNEYAKGKNNYYLENESICNR